MPDSLWYYSVTRAAHLQYKTAAVIEAITPLKAVIKLTQYADNIDFMIIY